MDRKVKSIQQHEPLRVPSGWKDQEVAFIEQLDRIFDDLYKRFGRIDWKDFGEALKNSIVTNLAFDTQTQELTITINGTTSGIVKIAPFESTVTNVSYDQVNRRIKKTINGTQEDVIAVSNFGPFTWGEIAAR